MADQVPTLKRLGYFSGWDFRLGQPGPGTEIGILVVNDPNFTGPLNSVFLPKLAAAGYTVKPENIRTVRPGGTTNELSNTIADAQSAALRFAQSNVTHVIIFDANGLVTLFFAQNANTQRYYPRLGMASTTGAQALYDTGVITNQQLNGAVGLGWLPSIDIPGSEWPPYQTAATKRCLKIMKDRTGQTYDSANAASIALAACDAGFLAQQALNKMKGDWSLKNMIAAIEAVRGGYDSSIVPGTYFGPGRHDAVQTGFDMKWNTGCSCTQYVGKHTIP